MDFGDLLTQFGDKVGLPGLHTEDDSCRIEIDGMRVTFMEHRETNTLVTWAEVSEPPPEGVTVLYRVLMEAMFMGQATGGSAFSIDPKTGNIYLHRVDSLLVLDLDSFSLMLERFVNVLEQWRKMIADYRPVAGEVEKKTAESEAPMSFGSDFMQV